MGDGIAADLPLGVGELPLQDGLDEGVGAGTLLRRGLGAGVGLAALLVAHGFDVAAAAHPPAWDLVVLAVAAGVTTPLILRHLRWGDTHTV